MSQQLAGSQSILRALEGFLAFPRPVPFLVRLKQRVQGVKDSGEDGDELPIVVQ